MRKKLHIMIWVLLLMVAQTAMAGNDTPNARQARRIFNTAFNRVFHSEGCTFSYDVNLVGIYKCSGRIWIADKNSHYEEKRYTAWDNGTTIYRVDKKRKEVEIHNAHSPKKDKYSSKFKFKPDEYDYHIADNGNTYIISLKLSKQGHSTIKQIKVELTKRGLVPVQLRCKVYFIWCRVRLSNFKLGKLDDSIFVYPRQKYSSYKLIDKRPD